MKYDGNNTVVVVFLLKHSYLWWDRMAPNFELIYSHPAITCPIIPQLECPHECHSLPRGGVGAGNFQFWHYFRLVARCIVHACARHSYTMSSAHIIGPKWQWWSDWHSSCLSVCSMSAKPPLPPEQAQYAGTSGFWYLLIFVRWAPVTCKANRKPHHFLKLLLDGTSINLAYKCTHFIYLMQNHIFLGKVRVYT